MEKGPLEWVDLKVLITSLVPALLPSFAQALITILGNESSAPIQAAVLAGQPSPVMEQQAGLSGYTGLSRGPPPVGVYHYPMFDSEQEDQTDDLDAF